MNNKTLGMIVLLDLAVCLIWLAVLIALNVVRGPIETFDQALAFVTERHWLFYTTTYINAILLTCLNLMVYAGLYALLRNDYPLWAAIGFAFVPLYGLLALFSYLSQIVIVPRLVELYAIPEYKATVTVLLRHLIQMWPESSLQYLDQFSYAVGSIPSFIFGIWLWRTPGRKSMQWAGGLYALSGATGPFIGGGVLAQLPQLVSAASMLGGIVSMVALGLLGVTLMRQASASEKTLK
jgi:hypothetical protein